MITDIPNKRKWHNNTEIINEDNKSREKQKTAGKQKI